MMTTCIIHHKIVVVYDDTAYSSCPFCAINTTCEALKAERVKNIVQIANYLKDIERRDDQIAKLTQEKENDQANSL